MTRFPCPRPMLFVCLVAINLSSIMADASLTPAKILDRQAFHTRRPISCLYMDQKHHRLLAQIGSTDTGPTPLVWVQHGRLHKLMEVSGFMYHIRGVDFQRQLVFVTQTQNGGWGAYLSIWPFPGTKLAKSDVMYDWGRQEANLAQLVLGKQPGRNYRVYFPGFTDLAEPLAYACTYQGNRLVKRQNIGRLPHQMLYVSATDEVYLVFDGQLKTLSGRSIPLPNGRPPNTPGYDLFVPASVLGVASSGRIGYYIDTLTNQIYKLDLTDGRLLATRALPFVPISLAVDSGQQIIYLLVHSGKSIVSINEF